MNDVLEFIVERRLESPNKSRGFHWRRRHRDTLAWELMIRAAIRQPAVLTAWSLILAVESRRGKTGRGYVKITRKPERRRVIVTRIVSSGRGFIRDEDNLRFSVKPLNDALKRLGLITDDSTRYLEQPPPEQRIAPDGVEKTLVRIERCAELPV